MDPFQRFVKIRLGSIVDSDDLCAGLGKILGSGRVKGMAPCEDPDLVPFGQESFDDIIAEASRRELSTPDTTSDGKDSLCRKGCLGRHCSCFVVVRFGWVVGWIGGYAGIVCR